MQTRRPELPLLIPAALPGQGRAAPGRAGPGWAGLGRAGRGGPAVPVPGGVFGGHCFTPRAAGAAGGSGWRGRAAGGAERGVPSATAAAPLACSR